MGDTSLALGGKGHMGARGLWTPAWEEQESRSNVGADGGQWNWWWVLGADGG